MVGTSFVDDVDCGSFFDHIDDLLVFPTDDVDASLPPATSYCDSFPSIWSSHDSDFSVNCASDLSAELSVPYEDIVQLEWLSNFMEDSFSGGGLTINKENPSPQLFRTSSLVSVLESSSSCSGAEKSGPRFPEPIVPGLCGRARSKRPRPETFSSRPPTKLVSHASSVSDTPQPFVAPKVYSDSENCVVSHTLNKKRRKIKSSIPLGPVDSNQNAAPEAVRKCLHCEITKTPQWRAGPMGPKTLCNACGVRYKSGRLCPEYRPAASPTSVPSVHSNSHRKVLEMRNKFGEVD